MLFNESGPVYGSANLCTHPDDPANGCLIGEDVSEGVILDMSG